MADWASLTFLPKPAFSWLHWPVNRRIDGRKDWKKEERMVGRSWEQTLMPRGHTNPQTHIHSVIQSAHGISNLFMTATIFVVPDPFVCVWVCVTLKLSWSLGISVQTNTVKCMLCGKSTICWSVKRKSPHDRDSHYSICSRWDSGFKPFIQFKPFPT